ncbi:Protein kinase-like domain protein [Paramyrothecium foliicola]|nr:Protein kinase-like domain protein [Paramyrothecium foliicola]
MSPYMSNPDDISPTDSYADVPFYGRYFPREDDFRVDPQHANSHTGSTRPEGGRDVFALGIVIVKSSHLHNPSKTQRMEIDYSYVDAAEIQAITIVKNVLKHINGRQVLVQERLPGVSLTVAWPYLSRNEKEAFKQQARTILGQLHTAKPTNGCRARSHVVEDPNILSNGRIHALEGDILFSSAITDPDMSFMHNGFTESNCIVDRGEITGLVDWGMAGYFGWETAGEVHRRIRTPQREHFVNAKLSEERLQEIMSWSDLYDDGMPEV